MVTLYDFIHRLSSYGTMRYNIITSTQGERVTYYWNILACVAVVSFPRITEARARTRHGPHPALRGQKVKNSSNVRKTFGYARHVG